MSHPPLIEYNNPNLGDWFYTADLNELGLPGNFGWQHTGIAGYVSTTQIAGLVPLYRYWNWSACDHFYTISIQELGAGAYGWVYESIAGYVSLTAKPNMGPLYRYWYQGHHRYICLNQNSAPMGGAGLERLECYIFVNASVTNATDSAQAPESDSDLARSSSGPQARLGENFLSKSGMEIPYVSPPGSVLDGAVVVPFSVKALSIKRGQDSQTNNANLVNISAPVLPSAVGSGAQTINISISK